MAGQDPLADAKRLLGIDPPAALLLARDAHRRAPSPQSTLLLAAACRRTGLGAEAAGLLRPLAAALPRAGGVQFELGMALAVTGDISGAIAALDRAVAAGGGTLARAALTDLRMVAGVSGNASPADPLADPALRQAIGAYLDGDRAAPDVLRRRFGLDSHDVAALCLLSDCAARLGRYEAAATLAADALGKASHYGPARFRLAIALHRAERDEEALSAIEPLSHGRSAPVLSLRGAILLRLGREAQATADMEAVTDQTPDDPQAWLALGHARRAIGARDAALAAYRRAIALSPGFGEAYWSIADMKTGAFEADELDAMRGLLADDALAVAARSHIGFALGRACEEAGEFKQAFHHYAAANAARRSFDPYDIAAHEAFVERMIALLTPDFFAARAGMGDGGAGPIFVLGMPRAGSTLVEQILASHSQVEGIGELPFVTTLARRVQPYPQALAGVSAAALAEMGAAYRDMVRPRRRSDRPRFVDKFPGNAFHVALIHLMLPDATIIDVRRDARDNCLSLFSQSFAAGQGYSYDLGDLGRYYASYVALMRHIDSVLPGRVLRVDYEALVDDLEGQARRLVGHCGLSFELACLRFFDNERAVRTASSEQVRRPIYRGSVGRWRNFAPWLGVLDEILVLPAADTLATRR